MKIPIGVIQGYVARICQVLNLPHSDGLTAGLYCQPDHKRATYDLILILDGHGNRQLVVDGVTGRELLVLCQAIEALLDARANQKNLNKIDG